MVPRGSAQKPTARGCRGVVGVWEQGCYVHATVMKDVVNSSQTSPGASLLCVPPGVLLIPVIEPFAHFFLFFSILTGLLEGRSHTSFCYGTKDSAGNKTDTTVNEGGGGVSVTSADPYGTCDVGSVSTRVAASRTVEGRELMTTY